MLDYPWYAVGAVDDLQQGDLFPQCPLILPEPAAFLELLDAGVTEAALPEIPTRIFYADVLVLTQSCDLAKPDCQQVLVCPYQAATKYSKSQRAEIIKDRYVSLHTIESCDEPDIVFPQQVLDFRTVYGVPKDFLMALAAQRGTRARILPPYREHLAQAFARYFMRVGLPRDLRPEP